MPRERLPDSGILNPAAPSAEPSQPSQPPMNLADITSHLDAYLRIAEIPDSDRALNGLQVENAGSVERIVAAVDASQASIEHAAAKGRGTLLLVHHGLFWDGNLALTGRRYRRLATAIRGDVAVYSAHNPLDLHPEVGNNPVLAAQLGIPVEKWWGEYHGVNIGVLGTVDLARDDLADRFRRLLGGRVQVIPGGPERCRRVGIITGGAGMMIAAARDAGCDTFITGEGTHHTWFDAMEGGINVLYGGHYATETMGVKALAEKLGHSFGLPWTFFDLPTGR
ncbi:MAG TPA: Nif3-like dinuclear metal center hexameric protein [Gemmatimonadales bacterium]|nr:Nif3-like dinuclear metal center hexameric protein [Gemmatimonadales bacterium]